eukprot:CAMPEP_0182874580 /NCGR_PEP_ID=MMETSP0034_2-20130328/13030_1 /TAXON_ID=156128 /ORGANISM="Nephroselmis pyriformis, Strain CCMP717" /LENGTH=67 /DNA_ID=CAMNT_0025007297 /DNA_START=174 /DNA_END=374 /DNA_ORIENTATION=-
MFRGVVSCSAAPAAARGACQGSCWAAHGVSGWCWCALEEGDQAAFIMQRHLLVPPPAIPGLGAGSGA